LYVHVGYTFASFFADDGFGRVSVEAFLAIVTVATVRVVAAIKTNAATDSTRHLVEFHVKTTLASMLITLAR